MRKRGKKNYNNAKVMYYCIYVTFKTSQMINKPIPKDNTFQVLQFLISEYKKTFQFCISDLNSARALKVLASYIVLNMKIDIAVNIKLQSLNFCSPR